MNVERTYIDCQCDSAEHTLRFTSYEWGDGPPDLCLEVFLATHEGFWERCWVALKYICGYKCKYGHFDSAVIKRTQLPKLQTIISDYIEMHNKFVKSIKDDK